MPFYNVSVGYRLSNEKMNAIRLSGIPLEIYPEVVRIRKGQNSDDDTFFIIEAVSEDAALGWADALRDVLSSTETIVIEEVENPDDPPDELDVYSKVGTWTKTGGVSTTAITSLGLSSKPLKALFLWGSGVPSHTTFNAYVEHGGAVFGFSDGTNEYCSGGSMQDNVGTTNSNTAILAKAYYIHDPTGNAANHIEETGTVGFDSDGFTITWSGTTTSGAGHYMAIWGDDISDVAAVAFDNETTDEGLHEYDLGIDFNPDFGLIVGNYANDAVGGLPYSDTDPSLTVCVNAGQTNERNWYSGISAGDGNPVATTARHQRYNRFPGELDLAWSSNFETSGATFEGWTDTGFIVDWTPNPPDFTPSLFIGIFIKGGKWDAGYFVQPATGGTSPVGDVRALLVDKYSVVKGLMCLSIGNTVLNSVVGNSNIKWSVGATDGTNEGLSGVSVVQSSDPTVTASVMWNNKLVSNATAAATATSSTEDASCTIEDISTPGEFTVHYDSSDGTARQVVWWTLSA